MNIGDENMIRADFSFEPCHWLETLILPLVSDVYKFIRALKKEKETQRDRLHTLTSETQLRPRNKLRLRNKLFQMAAIHYFK